MRIPFLPLKYRRQQSQLAMLLSYVHSQNGPILGIREQPELPYDSSRFVFRAMVGTEGDEPISGFGADCCIEMAVQKAIAEGIERYCVGKSPHCFSTNGVAAHFDYDAARCNALLENIERDCFLVHWLAGKNPVHIQPDSLIQRKQRRLIQRLIRDKHEVWLLGLTLDIPVPVFATIIMTPGQLPCIGLGCAFDPDHALEKALTESLRHLGAARHWKPTDQAEILRSIENGVLQGHRDYHWSDQGKNIRNILLRPQQSLLGYSEFLSLHRWLTNFDELLRHMATDHNSMFFTQLDTNIIDHKLVVVQSRVPSLQDLFAGPSNSRSVNVHRLAQLGLKYGTLIPHPLD